MKHLTLSFILLSIYLLPQAIMAQDSGVWATVTSPDEQFTAQMPQEPKTRKQKNKYSALDVDAHVYTTVDNGAAYTIWSLRNLNYTQAWFGDRENYLDECADLVWESLLEPEKEKLPKERGVYAYMSYQGRLNSGTIPGREYSITLGRFRGTTNFYVAGERIYVLTVLNATQDDAGAQRFLKSFAISGSGETNPPSGTASGAGIGPGEGVGPGRGSNNNEPIGGVGTAAATDSTTDYNRTFTTREVTQKARVLSRPEPSYTERARKYSVQGTVVIRAIISNTGQITTVKVVKGLPHGLTARAIEAAKLMKFSPALMDGQPVAQYVQIEYNFHLY